MSIKNFFSNYWKSSLLVVSILYLSFASSGTFKELPTFKFEDKLAHLLMYMTLTISLIYDYKNQKTHKTSVLPLIGTCVFFPIIFGGLIEIFQPILSETRSASWLDWSFNILGVLVGWSAFYGYFKVYKNRK